MHVAFINTRTTCSVQLLIKVLEEKDISREKVTHLIVTHIHLDHRGGTGILMQHFPNSVLVVHPRGSQHIIDQTILIPRTVEVYGEENTRKQYGPIIQVPEKRQDELPVHDYLLNAQVISVWLELME